MKKISAKLAALLCALLAVLPMSFAASAALKPDVNREIGISVRYEYNGVSISDVRFNLYKVADMLSDGQLVIRPEFAAYKVSYGDLSSEQLKSLSDTLSAYVMRDNVTPLSTAVTDKSGYAFFRSETKQTAGLYLVIGEKKKVGGYIYTPETLLISMPTLAEDGKTQLYKITAVPKGEVSGEGKKIQINVNKVWKNDGGTESRPKSVTVQLMRDNVIYSEITLNKNNNWRYTWVGLDEKYTWTIAEKEVPNGYTVEVKRSGKNYIIVNTGNPNDTTNPSGTTNPSDTTNPNNTTNPNGTTKPTTPSGSTTPSTTKPPHNIPQTGMLEWPIPLMLEFGAAFFVIGVALWLKRKNSDNGNKNEE